MVPSEGMYCYFMTIFSRLKHSNKSTENCKYIYIQYIYYIYYVIILCNCDFLLHCHMFDQNNNVQKCTNVQNMYKNINLQTVNLFGDSMFWI